MPRVLPVVRITPRTGLPGAPGSDGVGVPVGGTTGQVLAKNSDTDYDTEWVAPAGGGDALVANSLAQFAATTSLELKTLITDETGSGSLVFATSPTLVTPELGEATGTGITLSGLTASELVITNGSKKLVSAAVATYPSLTELTYVKGVTSAIQTQLGTKAPLTSPTFATSITGSYLTASELLITDGSKNIVSAEVATYPSLTELTYLKGVTSAIQTQLNGKQASGSYLTSANIVATITNGVTTNAPSEDAVFDALALKAPLASPSFTGTVTTSGSIELGHASDTTLSRVSAGVVSIEGVNILTTATGLPLSGGTMTGNITLGENASIALDPASSADGKYSGITVTGTAGATLAFGDLIYLDPTDSRWELVDGNAAAGADGDARGMIGMCVLAAASDGSATTILLQGIIRADANFPALTIGAPVYVAETAGDVVVTQPTTTDAVIRQVGFAMTADELYFNPTATWTTHT